MITQVRGYFTIKEFTGKHMLGVLFLFFGTIITVNMILAWFAVTSWSGLIAKNGYVASIDFKAKLEDVERQNALGWKSQLRLEGGHLFYAVKDRAGQPIQGLIIIGVIGRPATEAKDQKVSFREEKPGQYLARAQTSDGQWQVDVQAINDKKQRYRKIFRVIHK